MRPRSGRIVSALSSLGVTVIAVLGGLGVLPDGNADDKVLAGAQSPDQGAMRLSDYTGAEEIADEPPFGQPTDPEALPADSGNGKRVVFDISSQRVWLVDE